MITATDFSEEIGQVTHRLSGVLKDNAEDNHLLDDIRMAREEMDQLYISVATRMGRS